MRSKLPIRPTDSMHIERSLQLVLGQTQRCDYDSLGVHKALPMPLRCNAHGSERYSSTGIMSVLTE